MVASPQRQSSFQTQTANSLQQGQVPMVQHAVIESIVSQHAEEAAFLWLLRDAAVRAPHYSLQDLAALDERVEAHLDGLRIAGQRGWELCEEALENPEPGEVFAASVLAFGGSDADRVNTVIKAGLDSYETSRGLISALGWLAYPTIEPWIETMLQANAQDYLRISVAACVAHRVDPGEGLVRLLDDPEPRWQARALRAAGELKRHDLLPQLLRRFDSEHELCRFWAAWSACLLGDPGGQTVLESFALFKSRLSSRALNMLLRCVAPARGKALVDELRALPDRRRDAIFGVGVLGDPVFIPWLIEQMEIPELARVAGEAFSMTTGVDIAYENLEGETPEGFAAGPTENPEDADTDMDMDEDLPWPDESLIRAWWGERQGQLMPGKRYLLGAQFSETQCHKVLVSSLQRQRFGAALELAIADRESPLFEIRAPAQLQLVQLE